MKRTFKVVSESLGTSFRTLCSRRIPIDCVRQLNNSLFNSVTFQKLIYRFEPVFNKTIIFRHHSHFSNHVDSPVQTSVLQFANICVFFIVFIHILVHYLKSDSKSFFFEPDPVFLVSVNSYYNLFKNFGISSAKVILEVSVAVWKFSVKLFIIFCNSDDLSYDL
jgi:hypothetical protein